VTTPTEDTRIVPPVSPPSLSSSTEHDVTTTEANGTLTTETTSIAHVSADSTVQAPSATTDVVSAPVPYEPAQPPSLPPPPNGGPPNGMADPPPGEEEEDGMTMLEHLEELRVRIIVCAVALVLGLVISAVPIPYVTDDSVTQAVIHIISLPAAGHLIFIKPGEGFVTYFQVAMIVAIVLALPVMTYQAIAFVLPALLPHEKKYLYLAIPGAMISFTIGLLFGYILLLPVAIQFLLNFGTGNIEGIEVKWSFSEYIGTVTTLLFWMGLSFETPLLMYFLTKLHILNPQRVARYRKYALVLAFVIGAIITPTPDPLNQTIVSLPLYLLFELGLLLSRLA
jgi:sec-independent protein translocase protein TatC